MKRRFIVSAVLMAAGCLPAHAQSSQVSAASDEAPRRDEQLVYGAGTLTTDRTIPLAFERAGTLRALAVEVGAVVESGATIAQLDDEDSRLSVTREAASVSVERAALERLRADEATLRRRIAIAERERERSQRLSVIGSGTELERDHAEDALSLGQLELASALAQRPTILARVAQAQARAALARRSLERDRIIAPTRARVLQSDLAPGAFVGAGQTVVQLAPVGDERASVWVHESELPSVRVGARATVTLRDRERTRLDATVLRVRPEADPRTHEVRVDLRLARLPSVVVFGVRLDARIERARAEAP